MRHSAAILNSLCLVALAFVTVSATTVKEDHFHWNYMELSYEKFFLEDYCGAVNGTHCRAYAHTVNVKSTGAGSAVVIRGFRRPQKIIKEALRCCIRVRTSSPAKFNLEFDDITRHQRARETVDPVCDNSLRVYDSNEELHMICKNASKRSMRSSANEVLFEFVANANNPPELHKIKITATAAPNASALLNQHCNTTSKEWMCDNGLCVWDGFRCDGHDNCGDMSDELRCSFFARNWPLIVAFGCLSGLLSMCFCIYQCCFKSCRKTTSKSTTIIVTPPKRVFQYVSQLDPPAQPVVGKIYPTVHKSYQRMDVPSGLPLAGAPPPYSESVRSNKRPASKPAYGSI